MIGLSFLYIPCLDIDSYTSLEILDNSFRISLYFCVSSYINILLWNTYGTNILSFVEIIQSVTVELVQDHFETTAEEGRKLLLTECELGRECDFGERIPEFGSQCEGGLSAEWPVLSIQYYFYLQQTAG